MVPLFSPHRLIAHRKKNTYPIVCYMEHLCTTFNSTCSSGKCHNAEPSAHRSHSRQFCFCLSWSNPHVGSSISHLSLNFSVPQWTREKQFKISNLQILNWRSPHGSKFRSIGVAGTRAWVPPPFSFLSILHLLGIIRSLTCTIWMPRKRYPVSHLYPVWHPATVMSTCFAINISYVKTLIKNIET